MEPLLSRQLDMEFSVFTTLTERPGLTGSHEELYAGLIDMFVLADELGFESGFVAEHHMRGDPDKGYPLVPNPAVMLAAIAMRTSRIRIGPGVVILPFHNPLEVVENYAMVDQLSGGRLVMGVGSGDPNLAHEIAGVCVPESERFARYLECLKVMEVAWRGEPITYDGVYHSFADARVSVLPKQSPPPRIHVAASRIEAVRTLGALGYWIYALPYNGVAALIDAYREGRESAGLGYDPAQHAFMFNTFVAATEAEARERFGVAAKRAGAEPDWAKYEQMIGDGIWLVGSVDQVADRLVELHRLGLRKVFLAADFVVGMAMDDVFDGMRRFAAEVVPQVAARVSADESRRASAG